MLTRANNRSTSSNSPSFDALPSTAKVTVPVQFSVADHESVWDTTPEALNAITGLFARPDAVRLNHMANSGHNVSVGRTADRYHRNVLSFLEECIADSGRDRKQVEAS